MPYSAFNLNLAAVIYLCGGWTTAQWPLYSVEALGEVSGWYQPAGMCNEERIKQDSRPSGIWLWIHEWWIAACSSVNPEWMSPRLCPNTTLHLGHTQSHTACCSRFCTSTLIWISDETLHCWMWQGSGSLLLFLPFALRLLKFAAHSVHISYRVLTYLPWCHWDQLKPN